MIAFIGTALFANWIVDEPFKTGTDEDGSVNAMMIALLLLETKDRHYKSHNLSSVKIPLILSV